MSLRRHGQLDVTLARLIQLGTIDGTLASFLAAAVREPVQHHRHRRRERRARPPYCAALASEIPPGERVATLESEYELFLHGTGRSTRT